MEEYIGRNALLKDIASLKKSPWYNDDYGFGTKQARQEGVSIVENLCIKQAPAADVVEVVRCKDCTYGHFVSNCSKYMCEKGCGTLKYSNDFCNYGKRNRN